MGLWKVESRRWRFTGKLMVPWSLLESGVVGTWGASETNDGMNVFENNMKESDESALASLEHDSANRFD